MLELPQQQVALRIAERAHDVGARRFAAQGLVEDVEVDLGLPRQPILEQLVRDTEQPDERVAFGRRQLGDLADRDCEDIADVTLAALAIEREPEHEVVQPAPMRLDDRA